LPALKNGIFFGLILTISPVLGFRPVCELYFLAAELLVLAIGYAGKRAFEKEVSSDAPPTM
jgi:hypothetical protein